MDYPPWLRDARMQLVLDAIEAQAAPARIIIYTAAWVQLCVIELAKPSFILASGKLTLAPPTPRQGFVTTAGTATRARIMDGANNIVVDNLTVGLSGSDINLGGTAFSSTTFALHQSIAILSAEIS